MDESGIGQLSTIVITFSFVLMLASIGTAIWKFNALKSKKDLNGSMVYLSGIMYGIMITTSILLATIGFLLKILAVITAQTIDPTFPTFSL